MGIDARIETETGEPLAEVGDPRGYLAWGLSLSPQDSTVCLRFVDPYANTTFNQLQLPTLLSELQATQATLTNRRLGAAKNDYLARAASWPEVAKTDAKAWTTSFSLKDIRRHFDQVIALVQDAITRGPHHYVRFIGD